MKQESAKQESADKESAKLVGYLEEKMSLEIWLKSIDRRPWLKSSNWRD